MPGCLNSLISEFCLLAYAQVLGSEARYVLVNSSPALEASGSMGPILQGPGKTVKQSRFARYILVPSSTSFAFSKYPQENLSYHVMELLRVAVQYTSPRGIQFKAFLELCSERFGILVHVCLVHFWKGSPSPISHFGNTHLGPLCSQVPPSADFLFPSF